MDKIELRIGNFVFYNGSHQETGKVSGVIDCLVTEPKVFIDFRIDIPYQLSSLKPIPLTEEWFIRLGFQDNGILYFIECNGYDIIYDGFNVCLQLRSEYLRLEIKYVHQLQNLYFSLTGEELTIK